MRPFLLCAVMMLLAAGQAFARGQADGTDPGLRQRPADVGAADAEEAPEGEVAGLQPGHTSLPIGAWGEYQLGAPGEVVELDAQDGRLQGYISRLGGGGSDKGTALTYFFARSTISGTRVTFGTRAVHGLWYSFAGEIKRGGAERELGDAGYALVGTLTEHAQGKEQPRRVSLRKIPVYRGSF